MDKAKMVKRDQSIKYKKAPQAPRRFKSAYMFFSTDKHKQIRKELGEKLQTTEVAKMVSQAWKNLPAEEREEWEEMARRDKARYEVEKTMYTGPWKIPAKKRTQKDPSAPKRPMSAFLSFSNSKRAMVKAQNPDIGNAEVSRILAKMWKEAPEEERKEHIEREYELRQEYKCAIAQWRKTADRELEELRKKREEMAMRTVDASGQPGPDGIVPQGPPGDSSGLGVGGGPAGGGYPGMEQHPYHHHPHPHMHNGPHQYHHPHHHHPPQHQLHHPQQQCQDDDSSEMDKHHPPSTVMSASSAQSRGPPPYGGAPPPYGGSCSGGAPSSNPPQPGGPVSNYRPPHYGSYSAGSTGVPGPGSGGPYDETSGGASSAPGIMEGNPSPYGPVTTGSYSASQDGYGMPSPYSQGYGPPAPDVYEGGYDANMSGGYYGGYYHHQESMVSPWASTGPGGYYGPGATRSPVGATTATPAGAGAGGAQAAYSYGGY